MNGGLFLKKVLNVGNWGGGGGGVDAEFGFVFRVAPISPRIVSISPSILPISPGYTPLVQRFEEFWFDFMVAPL